MRFVTVFVILELLSACSRPIPIRAAYLSQAEGQQLAQAELDKHPEILVTHDFAEFKKATRHRIGLWIDKNATQLVEAGWLDRMPQASYPMVMVGISEPFVGFGFRLQMCCFTGYIMDAEQSAAAGSGFSVMERESGRPGAALTMIQGFPQPPTVEDILKISNDLLDGDVTPMPSPVFNP